MTDFLAAESKLEATARIYALSGAPPEPLGPGSKEKKSVLIALARALALDMDESATKPTLGGEMSEALGASWDATCYSTGATITLEGLNRLLRAAAEAFERWGAAARPDRSPLLAALPEFEPARSKLEAVNRISALTSSGPETLGPGSKERKSVLANLVLRLHLESSLRLSKSRLGEDIAGRLQLPWDGTCHSTGETITLNGLNVILAGVERRLGDLGLAGRRFRTEREEAAALLGVLDTVVEPHWDGKQCVERMRSAEFSQWRHMEWPGFYFEFVGIPALVDGFGGGPARVHNVTFDYDLDTLWDLKCHAIQASEEALLNDSATIRTCIVTGPLGFIVLSGDRHLDPTGEFDAWHRDVTVKPGRVRRSNSEHRRARKAGFTPRRMAAYVIRDLSHHDSLVTSGSLAVVAQGRQADGSPRNPKYRLRLDLADRNGMDVARVERHGA